MKKRTIFVLGFIFIFSGFVFAQETEVKTITNADLEKFRVKRLKAEKDLRENYAEMGFSSPEEIERQNEESRRRLNEFADQLREERLAREAGENEIGFTDYGETYQPNGFIDYGGNYANGFYYYNGRSHRNNRPRRGSGRFYGNQDFQKDCFRKKNYMT